MYEFLAGVVNEVRARVNSLTVGTAMAVVSFCSGFISYTHISALTQDLGGSWKTAHLMPFCVDGQIVIGSAYFMYGKSWWSKSAGLVYGIVPGIGESLIANWESGIVHGLFAAGWSTVPAQSFACSTILFERWLHARRERAATAGAKDSPVTISEAAPSAPEPAAPAAPAGAGPIGLPAPVMGPVTALADRPVPDWIKAERDARRRAPRAVPDEADTRLPLPEDESELAAALAGRSRNKIFETYQVSKGKASTLVAARDAGTLAQWLAQYAPVSANEEVKSDEAA